MQFLLAEGLAFFGRRRGPLADNHAALAARALAAARRVEHETGRGGSLLQPRPRQHVDLFVAGLESDQELLLAIHNSSTPNRENLKSKPEIRNKFKGRKRRRLETVSVIPISGF